jgi:hypothetical protein
MQERILARDRDLFAPAAKAECLIMDRRLAILPMEPQLSEFQQ